MGTAEEPEAHEVVQTFTILTTTPVELCSASYQMPVILGQEEWGSGLERERRPPIRLLGVLRPFPTELMRAYPVDRRRGMSPRLMPACWMRSLSRPDMSAIPGLAS